MTPERWRRLEDLFEMASAMPSGERGVWLDRACADDAELRAELDAMLRADGVTHLPIERALEAGHAIAEAAAAVPMIGRRIGPYRITAVLGYGGMGSVFAAARDDQVYLREVAIKVLRNELVEGPAALDHPSIARLIDGGEDPAPYLVMDRIEGVSIAEYCEGRATRRAAASLPQSLRYGAVCSRAGGVRASACGGRRGCIEGSAASAAAL